MPIVYTKGKVVYWVRGQRFENSKDKRNGKDKAEEYCLDNFINPSEIQKFDSRTECDYYEYLLEKQNKGEISNLGHHFLLLVQDEYQNANGDLIPKITYEADFVYKDNLTNKRMVVDVKGSPYFIDERFTTLKQVFDKAFKEKGLYIQVILKQGQEWVEWRIGDKKKSGKLIVHQRKEIKKLREQAHKVDMENRKADREKKRIIELRDRATQRPLTSTERKRLESLEEKYKI